MTVKQQDSPRDLYLDYAATTPLDPRVAEAMHTVIGATRANPASLHQAGRSARKLLEQQRDRIIELLGGQRQGMRADRLLFTSGGTEANNLALFGLAGRTPGRVIVSAVEHPSVLGAAEELVRRGFTVEKLAVDSHGVASIEQLAALLSRPPLPRLVSLMLGNNETGVLQSVAEAARLCREHRVPLHTDAVQAIGKIEVDFNALGVDALTIAPHKFSGPIGVGGLLLRYEVKLEPQLFGGFQQGGMRPGTESLPLVVGFARALEIAIAERAMTTTQIASRRDRFEQSLQRRLPDVHINGGEALRLPHVSNVAFLGVDRQQLFLALDFARVFCSTGSACASGSSEASHVLIASGASPAIVASSLRFSFGRHTSDADVDEAVDRIATCVERLRVKNPAAGETR